MKPFRRIHAQRGVALAVALILLVVLTLLALSGVRLSTMELRMALSDEMRVNAFEQAQSLVDGTVRRFSNTPILAPGIVRCAKTPADTDGDGDNEACAASIVLPTAFQSDLGNANVDVNVLIRRIAPQNAEPPVGTGFSLTSFDAAYMQVSGLWDKNTEGRGRAMVNEGIAIVYGSAGDITLGGSQDEFSGAVPPP